MGNTGHAQTLQERLHKAGAELWQTALNEAEQRLAQRLKEIDEEKVADKPPISRCPGRYTKPGAKSRVRVCSGVPAATVAAANQPCKD
ncbi:hypothetical protein LRD18_06660 [Halorhodospira halochloris]|nr:hypothetical protein [Halorhodospira halochloris]MCG5530552.1 hypothetical protein [Halorhodospira halochloris]